MLKHLIINIISTPIYNLVTKCKLPKTLEASLLECAERYLLGKKNTVGNQLIKSPQNSGSWLRYYNLYPQKKTQVLQNQSVSCRLSSQEPASVTLSAEQSDPSSGTPAIPNAPGKRWREALLLILVTPPPKKKRGGGD